MVGSSGRWVVVGVAAVLVALALLGQADPTDAGEVHESDGVSTVVDTAASLVVGGGASGDAAGRGLARASRPVALPVGDDEAVLAGAVATALLVGGWVLQRGDGWGVRPVVASPLATRRGPPR